MLRFIRLLFGFNFEECKGCEILKEELRRNNEEKEALLQTLISIVKPETVQVPMIQVNKSEEKTLPFRVRKQVLERESAKAAQIMAEQERINKLEEEMNIAREKRETVSVNGGDSPRNETTEGDRAIS